MIWYINYKTVTIYDIQPMKITVTSEIIGNWISR